MRYEFDTLKIQGGYDFSQHNHAVSVPIYQTTAFSLEDSDRATGCFLSRRTIPSIQDRPIPPSMCWKSG